MLDLSSVPVAGGRSTARRPRTDRRRDRDRGHAGRRAGAGAAAPADRALRPAVDGRGPGPPGPGGLEPAPRARLDTRSGSRSLRTPCSSRASPWRFLCSFTSPSSLAACPRRRRSSRRRSRASTQRHAPRARRGPTATPRTGTARRPPSRRPTLSRAAAPARRPVGAQQRAKHARTAGGAEIRRVEVGGQAARERRGRDPAGRLDRRPLPPQPRQPPEHLDPRGELLREPAARD